MYRSQSKEPSLPTVYVKDDFDEPNENEQFILNGDTHLNRRNISREVKATDFDQRRCCKFVRVLTNTSTNNQPDSNNICAHCKKEFSPYHDEVIPENLNPENRQRWYELCTISEPTDGYGQIPFCGSDFKKAKFIKVKTDTPIEQMSKYMFDETGFNLHLPKLIISVTGGAQNLILDEDTKFALKMGLMKVAKSTDAWIISGGTNVGVMRLVGDAVNEEFHDLPVIGLVSWGVIADDGLNINRQDDFQAKKRKSIRYRFPENSNNAVGETPKKVVLNPNHSHFIFVDDGSYGEFGVEIDFRTNLETYISNEGSILCNQDDDKIPMVLVVVGGGIGTLKTIKNAIDQKFPVILVEKSGYAADRVINALKNTTRLDFQNYLDCAEFRRASQEEKNNYIELLKEIVDEKNRHYLNVFAIQKNGIDSFEPTILNALQDAETNVFKNIQFAVKWDKFDIAKAQMNSHNNKLKQHELQNLLELALIENKPKFVALFLENDVNLEDFCTVSRLKNLYNNELKQGKIKNEEPFLVYLRKRKMKLLGTSKINEIKVDLISKFLHSLFNTFDPNNYLPGSFDDANLNDHHELNLFIWCILSNRIEIAKIFWRLGEYQICYALMASRILNFFANEIPDLKSDLEKSADEFEDLAIGVVRIFDENTREIINDTLIIRYLEPVQMDCLKLAAHCDCTRFLSHPSIQKVFDGLWYGKTSDDAEMTAFEKSLRECQEKHNNRDDYIFNNDNVCLISNGLNCWQKFVKKMSTPSAHFIIHVIFYMLFLGLFSYVMLFKYKYISSPKSENNYTLREIVINETNKTNKSTRSLDIFIQNLKETVSQINISMFEIILLIWIFAILVEEIRQFISVRTIKQTTWEDKVTIYLKNNWNLLDIVGCTLFIIGFILKGISLNSANMFSWSRIFMGVDLVVWFMRALYFCLFIKALGPKLHMIRKMIEDLKYFLIIVSIFIFAFGISIESIMDSEDSFNPITLLDILTVAYWPIYGEITALDEVTDTECEPGKVCRDTQSKTVAYFLLMVYLLIANVLLLNILIAMFSSTFEQIQNNSDGIWKNQRYHLICEYADSPLLAPPLNLLNYLWFGMQKLIKRCKHTKESNNEQCELTGCHRIDTLIDYEQKCTKKLFKEIKSKFNELEENKVCTLNERMEALEKQFQELIQRLDKNT